MEQLFLQIVNTGLVAGWLVLAVLILRILLKKAPKWITCLLWGLVAVRLVLPFSIESSLSLIPSAKPLPDNFVYTAQPKVDSGVQVIDLVVNPILAATLQTENVNEVSANTTQIASFLFSRIWAAGAALMIVYAIVSTLILKSKLRTATLLEKGIMQSEKIASPFVLGICKPTIYLPYHMKEGNLPHVIKHEKAHIRRGDNIWKPLGFIILSVYWFHPILWVAYGFLCKDIESACDEKVIQNMDADSRKAYSTALLECSIRQSVISACPVAFCENGVKARVKDVMNYKKPAFWIVCVSVIACIVVAVCFLTNPKKESGDTEDLQEASPVFPMDEDRFPYGDISKTRVRTMGVAYTPYVLELNDEEKEYLSNAFLASSWTFTADDIPLPDGEAYVVYVYEKGAPYMVTFYSDGHAEIECQGNIKKYWVRGEADLAASKFCTFPSDTERLILCEVENLTSDRVWSH